MFKLITANMKMESAKRPASVTPAMDQIYVKMADGTEIIIPCKLTPQLTASINLIHQAQAPNLTLDLTNPKQPVSFV